MLGSDLGLSGPHRLVLSHGQDLLSLLGESLKRDQIKASIPHSAPEVTGAAKSDLGRLGWQGPQSQGRTGSHVEPPATTTEREIGTPPAEV